MVSPQAMRAGELDGNQHDNEHERCGSGRLKGMQMNWLAPGRALWTKK
jgi:hypothetical protein